MVVTSDQKLSSPAISIAADIPAAPKSSRLSTSNSVSFPAFPLSIDRNALAGDVVSISTANDTSPVVYDRPAVDASSTTQISPDVESENRQSEPSNLPAPATSDNSNRQEQQARAPEDSDADRSQQRAEERRDSEASSSALDDRQRQQIAELSARDQVVRAHEQAHQSVGGQYTGSVSFSYQTGPDGKRYAVGGEVPIDASPVSGDPLATIAKMRTVQAAANAPADPSSQDRKVAAAAARLLSRAQVELSAQKREEASSVSVSRATSDRVTDATRRYEEIIGLIEPDSTTIDAFV